MSALRARILVIDDTPLNLMTLGAVLEGEFELQFATSGPMGVALALRAPPELILLDVMMPEVDGYETFGLLAAQATLKDIPVIFVTALSDFKSEMTGLTLGAADYIAKPINIPVARQRIRNLIERERLRRQVEQQRDALQQEMLQRIKLEEELRKLSVAVEQSPVSIAITDHNAILEYVNPKFTELSGYSAAEVLGQNPRILKSGLTSPTIFLDMWDTLRRDQVWHGDLINRRKNGEVYWEESQIAPIKNAQGQTTHFVAIKIDISERKRAEQALWLSEQRLNDAQRTSHVGNWEFDLVSGELVWSDETFRIFEIDKACFGASYDAFMAMIHPDDRQAVSAAYAQSLETRQPYAIDHRLKLPDGRIKFVHESCETTFSDTGQPLRSRGTVQDVTQNKVMENQIRQMAFHDPLTGLANRRLLDDRLGQAMASSKRDGLHCALMVLDLDNFKTLNDAHGHGMGDLLLTEVATRLKACVREMDTVARMGGDEFVVVLTKLDADAVQATTHALAIAEKIRVSLTRPYLLSTTETDRPNATVQHNCSASIGVVVFGKYAGYQADLMKWADAAMYQAKDAGRNTTRLHVPLAPPDLYA